MFIKCQLSKEGRVETSTLTKPESTVKLEFFYEQIGCRLIEVVSLSNSILLICDEEGLLVSGNPVYDVHLSKENDNIQIAGTFIIAKEGENFEITGLNSSDIKEVSGNISVSRFGITKGRFVDGVSRKSSLF